ncbi:hypothetical protein QBC45DRAFT_490232 [Copromyces sp. CBS 386.78]|nr:hypothetical protein QBC45DRAFT_490232 [Copromyces sp. CBS 386.78]
MERRATDRSSDSQRSGKSPENNHGGVQKDTTPSHDAEHPRRAPIPQLLQAPKVPIVQPADTIIVAHGQPLFKSNGSATPFHNNSNVPPTSSSSQPLGNVPAALDPAYRQVASPDSRSLAGSGASSLDSTPGISRLARGDRPGAKRCFDHLWGKPVGKPTIRAVKERHALGIWCCTRCMTKEVASKQLYCLECRRKFKEMRLRKRKRDSAGNGGGDGTPNSEDAEYDENGEDNENDESGENGEDEAKYPQQRSSPKMSFDFDSDTSGASQK